MSATMNLEDVQRTETTVVTPVQFVCPRCGDDRPGVHVRHHDESEWVDCDECSYRCDTGVLAIPTEAVLAEWYSLAVRHGLAAMRCADGTPTCSYLAIVWCRRLAPELTLFGKLGFLDRVARPLVGTLTHEQRKVVRDLGVALQIPAAHLNDLLSSL